MCKICKKEFESELGLSFHLKIHDIKLLDYYIKYENFKIPECPYCGKNCKIRKGIKFNKTCCSNECKNKNSVGRKHSEEIKKVISQKRKEWLKNNPEKHPWKNNNKFLSKPCEELKKELEKIGISFISEVNLLKDRNYSVDIVIIEKGIGIEVNGNQHYNEDKTLKEYYKNRKNEIEKVGWKLYDIHYTKVYNKNFIKELIENIKGENNKLDLDFNIFEKKENFCKCGKKIYVYSKNCVKCNSHLNRKVERPDIEILLNDIKELGYSGTGRKYEVSDNAIRKWIKFANKK